MSEMTYTILRDRVSVAGTEADLYKVGFGAPAPNTAIVVDADKALATVAGNGRLALINGPASLPVAVVLTHWLGHRYSAVGVFDPKLSGYVVAMSHDPELSLGQLLK